jgi:hypothetical protein
MLITIIIGLLAPAFVGFLFLSVMDKFDKQELQVSKQEQVFLLPKLGNNKVLQDIPWTRKRQLEKQMLKFHNPDDSVIQDAWKKISKKWKKNQR